MVFIQFSYQILYVNLSYIENRRAKALDDYVLCAETTTDNRRIVGLLVLNAVVGPVLQGLFLSHTYSFLFDHLENDLYILLLLLNNQSVKVIYTNESNIERWKNKRPVVVDSKIGRLDNFINLVEVPVQVFIACGVYKGQEVDHFRKPQPGMWRIMEQLFLEF
ncbi:polynucleotide 3'-phosphatase ZDP [Tanacetum coccineum]